MKKALALLFVLLIIGLIFLPQIASFPFFKPFFEKKIEEKVKGNVTISSLHFSWFGPQCFEKITVQKPEVKASSELLCIEAPFWSFSGPFSLKDGAISYQNGKIEGIQAKVEGEDFSLFTSEKGLLFLKGKVYSKLHFDIQVDVKNFPTAAIDSKVQELLGPSLSIKGSIQMKGERGDLDLDIDSSYLKTHLVAMPTTDGFFLNEHLNITIELTPSLSQFLLKDISPLFLTSISAEKPIQIEIDSRGFFCPFPFSISKLKIVQGTLNLGKVQCKNGKTLSDVLAILKANPFSRSKEMQAWFTPVSFQVENGILTTSRMDALFDQSIHVCTWGKISLINNQIDMKLGLTASTLKKMFGIQNLPEDYVLPIDIRGTTESPEMNRAKAATQIAALVATNQIDSKGIFQGIKDLFSKKNSQVPKANHPFPWE